VSASNRELRFVSLASQFRHGYDMMRDLWCLDFHGGVEVKRERVERDDYS